MVLNKISAIVLTVVVAFSLAACESSEERAEKHFQSGMELLEAGDIDRALVEFRNVLKLNDQHRDARLAFANVMLDRGQIREAYGQFLAAAEQDPDDVETRIVLAELAAQNQAWEEADQYYKDAVTHAPDDPRIKAIGRALAYKESIDNEDIETRRRVMAETEELILEQPNNLLLRRILIDAYSRDQRVSDALEQLDAALSVDPEARDLQNVRVILLAQNGDGDGLEQRLIEMIELFPNDRELEESLIRFYVSQGRNDEAEAFLKQRADGADTREKYVDYIRFVAETRGAQAALDEVESEYLLEPDDLILTTLRAGLLFDLGSQDEAIASLQGYLDGSEPSSELNKVRVPLSRMLIVSGNEVGARRLVEETLESDPSNVDALKISAAWQINDDKPEEAISTLRTALDQEPGDADLMTLMAQAHQRNGSPQLARDMLALAVEASRNAPEESIRYADLLLAGGNLRSAEDVLINSLRLNENNISILAALGRLYVTEEDWPRANQVSETLRRIDTEQSNGVADSLQVAILSGQDRTDETVAFLEQLAQSGDNTTAAKIAIARAKLAAGDNDGAVAAIDESMAEEPDQLVLVFAAGAIKAATGDFEASEGHYRSLLETSPGAERVWLELIRVLNAQGKNDESLAALDEGLSVIPGAPNLLWARASLLEQNGDYEGAIGVYETLYEANSNAPIIANNLASLITTYRSDEESLERAYAVAKRLRGSEVPAFQDTYGWIAYRRGDLDEALEHLEPAAAALDTDPIVQYHLARTYLDLERNEEALAQFRKAVEVAGDADLREQIADARRQIIALEQQ